MLSDQLKLYTVKYGELVGGISGYAGYRNRRRLKVFARLIPVTGDDDILEIGANICLLLDAFKKKARSVVGIELNEEVVRKSARPDLICMSAINMTFADNSFTLIIAIEVLEHITELQNAFSEIERVLKPGGMCYISVPFEIFRGQQALGDAWYNFRDLSMARKLHVHKLDHKIIKEMSAHTDLKIKYWKFIWIPAPSYFIVLYNGK